MNIQQFNYILAVAEHRHFETAAEKCFVAQSTLSTMISRFEEEIGVKVFDRRVKPVELTKEGEQIVSQIKRIDFEIQQLKDGIKAVKGEMKGEVRIGCIPTIAPFLLPLLLKDFSKKYPELYLEIKELTTDEIEQRILSRDLDIGIVSTSILTEELNSFPIYEEAFILFDVSNTKQKDVEVATLDMDRFWLLEEGHCMRTQVLEVCEMAQPRLNPTLNISYKAGSIDSLLRFVTSNNGKTLLPALAITDFTEEEKQYLHYFKNEIPYRTIGLAVHPHFAKSKVLEMLTKNIIAIVKNKEGIHLLK